MPACRIAPPKRCFSIRARCISSCEPAISCPERAPQSFREAERRRVEPGRDLGGGDPRGDGGVHQPRSVEVRAQSELARRSDRLAELAERPHRSARRVVRVLEREHRHRRRPELAVVPHGRAHLLGADPSAVARKAARLEARVVRGAAELGDHDVRALLDDQLAAALAEDRERDLVAHRRGRQVDRFFVPEERSRRAVRARGRWDPRVPARPPPPRWPSPRASRASASWRCRSGDRSRPGETSLPRMADHDPYTLPPDLPVPEDDGAADHLTGRRAPARDARLDAGAGRRRRGSTFSTSIPAQARRASCRSPVGTTFRARAVARRSRAVSATTPTELAELGASRIAGLSTQTLDEQLEFAERNHMPFPVIADPELRLRDALAAADVRDPGPHAVQAPRARRGRRLDREGVLPRLPARPERTGRRRLAAGYRGRMNLDAVAEAARRRARLPHTPGLGVGRARRDLVRRDDEPAGARRAARSTSRSRSRRSSSSTRRARRTGR